MQSRNHFARALYVAIMCMILLPLATIMNADAASRGITNWTATARKASAKHQSARKASPYRYANITPSTGHYLNQTDGAARWASGRTIRVYVGPGKATGATIVANAFNTWSRASGGRIRWAMTNSPYGSDYSVGWTSRQRELASGTEAGTTTTDTYYDQNSGVEIIDHARTDILTRMNGRNLTDRELSETVLHEIGHGLGIQGHSSNPADIMYYAVSSRQTGRLTGRDSNSMAQLYTY